MTTPSRARTLDEIAAQLRGLRLSEEPGETLGSFLSAAREILGAKQLLLLFYDSEGEQLYRWECRSSDPRPDRSEIPLPDLDVWITLDREQEAEILGADSVLGERLDADSILSFRFPSGANCVRILAVDPRDSSEATLNSLREVGHELAPLVERFYLLRRVRALAIDEERNRIAQDFHDGPLQAFLGLEVQVQFIRRLIERDPQRAATELDQMQEAARRQVREIRDLLQEMRPVDLGHATLLGLLRQLCVEFGKSGGVQVQLYADSHRVDAPRAVSREVYQIVREAVANSRKHGNASHAVIRVDSEPDRLELVIDDDGSGYQFSGSYMLEDLDRLRIGPVSIKQRARQLGASLQLESTPGHGSRLTLRVPIKN